MASRPRPWIVADDLWRRVEPLLPAHPRRADGRGRPWRDDRKALCGILFVLHTGLPWEWLLQELGYGSGMTCWRRLRDWQQAGVWAGLHRLLLEELHQAGQIDWERAAVDGSHVRAMKGGEHTGPSPFDRSRPGSALCRFTITGNDWRRPDLQHRYGDHWTPGLLKRIRSSRTPAVPRP